MLGLVKPDNAETLATEFMINGSETRRGKRKTIIRILFTAGGQPVTAINEEVSVHNMRVCDVYATCANLPGLNASMAPVTYAYMVNGIVYFDFYVDLLLSPLSSVDVISFIKQVLHNTSISESGYAPAQAVTEFRNY